MRALWEAPMNTLLRAGSLAILLSAAVCTSAVAQVDSASGSVGESSANAPGIPLVTLIETVAKKTHKTFIVDPRVRGNANLIGLDATKLTYTELLNVLQVHGYAAVENDGIVRVIPSDMVRTTPTPLVTGNEKHPDAEVVSRVIKVKNLPAPALVPILRSLLPQNAHLAAMSCTNEILIVDSYANMRRIESLIASMDTGEPFTPPKCAPPEK
jgi:general secretion pathway protein D